jgi:hypothetical protein
MNGLYDDGHSLWAAWELLLEGKSLKRRRSKGDFNP